jgi:hypothetical protein
VEVPHPEKLLFEGAEEAFNAAVALRFADKGMQGRYDEAANAFSKLHAPTFAAGMLGYCYARSGRVSKAKTLLQNLKWMDTPMLAAQVAILHAGLYEYDAAFDSLSRACSEHNLGIQWLKVEPIWDDLRPDPRFVAALRQLRLDD